MLIESIGRLVTEKNVKNRKNERFCKIHISAIFKDVADIFGELIVIHMYFLCAKTRGCAIISFCVIAISIFE